VTYSGSFQGSSAYQTVKDKSNF